MQQAAQGPEQKITPSHPHISRMSSFSLSLADIQAEMDKDCAENRLALKMCNQQEALRGTFCTFVYLRVCCCISTSSPANGDMAHLIFLRLSMTP